MNEITEIGYIKLWCADLNGTRAFFTKLAGLPIAFEDENVIIFGMHGTQLILQRAEGENEFRAGTMQIGFYMDTLDNLLRDLRQSDLHLGIERMLIEAEQPSTRVRTPSGQFVEFIQRLTKEEQQSN